MHYSGDIVFLKDGQRGQHVYFRTRFSKPFASVEMDTTAIALKGKRCRYGLYRPL